MNQDTINSADEISIVTVLVLNLFLRAKAVEKTDFTQNQRFRSPQNLFTDPTKNCVRLKKTLRTSRDDWTYACHWTVACLCIGTKRTNTALLVADCFFLKRAE